MSNFVHTSFVDFLNEEFSWEVMDGHFYSVNNMSEKEIRESILSDLLGVVFWEKEKKEKVNFTVDTLLRRLTGMTWAKVQKQLEHEEIKNLIAIEDGQIRIRDDHNILQAAMEYAGVWFGDFKPEDPTGVLMVDREKLNEEVEKVGGLDNLIQSISMDLISNTAENISKH